MEIMTISEVSKQFQISTRMLRYYEKEGLISSIRIEGYAYRVYDDRTLRSLQQILILRKLRIPVKQIAEILEDEEQIRTLEILRKNLEDVNDEIAAFTVIRDMLSILASRLEENIGGKVRLDLLEETAVMDIIHVLKPLKSNLKEEDAMDELMKASSVLEARMDIRIVYLPPVAVASYQYIGENPEDAAGDRIYTFIKESNLPAIKPDFRLFGFNNPSPQEGEKVYGYEFWVTIPETIEVKEPVVKKYFAGGLYAAHCIRFGDFQEWGTFLRQLEENEEYEIKWREPFGMGGCLEEELNIYSLIQTEAKKPDQLDLLVPIQKKNRNV
ncbi:MAG: effector binding domain-containing protein [Lachnospiraceae bacterium]|nr:effector binding domain-containing protein [Lachnospiraceae bacterium]